MRSSQGSAFQHYIKDAQTAEYPKARLFEIKHELRTQTCFLLNDISAYVDRYSKFRIQNAQYFDLTDEEIAATEKP